MHTITYDSDSIKCTATYYIQESIYFYTAAYYIYSLAHTHSRQCTTNVVIFIVIIYSIKCALHIHTHFASNLNELHITFHNNTFTFHLFKFTYTYILIDDLRFARNLLQCSTYVVTCIVIICSIICAIHIHTHFNNNLNELHITLRNNTFTLHYISFTYNYTNWWSKIRL